jgi:hypothetical protein
LTGHSVQEITQEGGAGERMWTSAGATDDREPFQAQGIGNGSHVSSLISDGAASIARRTPVPRSISRDVTDTGLRVQRVVRPAAQAATRSPMKSDYGVAVRITAVEERHGATIPGPYETEAWLHLHIMPVRFHKQPQERGRSCHYRSAAVIE